MRYSIGLSLVVVGLACVGKADAPAPRGQPDRSEAPAAQVARPTFVAAAAGPVPAAIKAVIESSPERRVVAYVGAEWCEPCTRFHRAVQAGELDDALSGVQFVEFDSDRDAARLSAAGYDGKLIPRFVVPTADGAPSDRRIEGGIKGEGAVANILKRLKPLLGGS